MKFEYTQMPSLRPISIPSDGLTFFSTAKLWLKAQRKWKLIEDWEFNIDGIGYIISAGFVFDGASVPRYFWNFISPVGLLMIPGLVHDWLYKYEAFELSYSRKLGNKLTRKECDLIFRDIAIAINHITLINYVAYYGLYLFGWAAWNKHREDGSGT